MTTIEIVEKVWLKLLRPIPGVVSLFPCKGSSIVDRITKPLFLASYKEICSEAFSTVSYVISNQAVDLEPEVLGASSGYDLIG